MYRQGIPSERAPFSSKLIYDIQYMKYLYILRNQLRQRLMVDSSAETVNSLLLGPTQYWHLNVVCMGNQYVWKFMMYSHAIMAAQPTYCKNPLISMVRNENSAPAANNL